MVEPKVVYLFNTVDYIGPHSYVLVVVAFYTAFQDVLLSTEPFLVVVAVVLYKKNQLS